MPAQAGELQLGNSKLTITGSTFFLEYIKYPVVFIARSGFTLSPGTSTIEFTSADVDVTVEGDDMPLPFHKCLFSDPMGDTYLEARQPVQLAFDSLIFKNGARLLGNMQFDYLELAPGKGYSFESNITYTIGELQAAGQCEAPVQILGSSPVYVYFLELEYMDERGSGTETFSGDLALIR